MTAGALAMKGAFIIRLFLPDHPARLLALQEPEGQPRAAADLEQPSGHAILPAAASGGDERPGREEPQAKASFRVGSTAWALQRGPRASIVTNLFFLRGRIWHNVLTEKVNMLAATDLTTQKDRWAATIKEIREIFREREREGRGLAWHTRHTPMLRADRTPETNRFRCQEPACLAAALGPPAVQGSVLAVPEARSLEIVHFQSWPTFFNLLRISAAQGP